MHYRRHASQRRAAAADCSDPCQSIALLHSVGSEVAGLTQDGHVSPAGNRIIQVDITGITTQIQPADRYSPDGPPI